MLQENTAYKYHGGKRFISRAKQFKLNKNYTIVKIKTKYRSKVLSCLCFTIVKC